MRIGERCGKKRPVGARLSDAAEGPDDVGDVDPAARAGTAEAGFVDATVAAGRLF